MKKCISENGNDREKFTQALELLMSWKRENCKYPPPSEMEREEIEAIFQTKLNQKQ